MKDFWLYVILIVVALGIFGSISESIRKKTSIKKFINQKFHESYKEIIVESVSKAEAGHYFDPISLRQEIINQILKKENLMLYASEFDKYENWKFFKEYLSTELAFAKKKNDISRSEREKKKKDIELAKFEQFKIEFDHLLKKFCLIAFNKAVRKDDYGDLVIEKKTLQKEKNKLFEKIRIASPEYGQHFRNYADFTFETDYMKFVGSFFDQYVKDRSSDDNSDIENMSGVEFEDYLKHILEALEYVVVKTPTTGDQGADLIVEKGRKIVIQAKRWNNAVGNSAVQEAFSAMEYYAASRCMVITSSRFTKSAIELANRLNVVLISGSQIGDLKNILDEI